MIVVKFSAVYYRNSYLYLRNRPLNTSTILNPAQPIMRTTILATMAIAAFIVITVISCNNPADNSTTSGTAKDSTSKVKRGEYLVTIIGCDDCHSPKRMGANGPEIIPERRLSGFPQDGKLPAIDTNTLKKGWTLFSPDLTSAIGAWGASFSGNITSDATGIGNWTEENFIRCLREGKFKGLANGRPLLPPMPWNWYKNLTDEDLKALFAYLKTVAPVKNVAPPPIPPSALK